MNILDLCNQHVISTGRETDIAEAARLMREHHIGSLLVVDYQQDAAVPVGIITDRDIVVEVLAEELEPEKVSVGDIMSAELVCARHDASLWDAMKLMRMHGIRRLPILNEKESLAGIITVDDIMMILASEFTELVRVIGKEQTNEVRKRSGRK